MSRPARCCSRSKARLRGGAPAGPGTGSRRKPRSRASRPDPGATGQHPGGQGPGRAGPGGALQFAKQDAARYQDLAQRGAGSVQQSQQSTSNLQQQQASLDRANAAVTVAQRQIGSLQAQKAGAEASLARPGRRWRRPGSTSITRPSPPLKQAGGAPDGAVGQFAQAGQALSMFVPDDIWVTANFKETQITDMRPGQKVDVEIDAYPDHGSPARSPRSSRAPAPPSACCRPRTPPATTSGGAARAREDHGRQLAEGRLDRPRHVGRADGAGPLKGSVP